MFTQHSRMALLAGLIGAALSVPALAADVNTGAEMTLPDQPMVVASSPAAQPGSVVASPSLAPEKGSEVAVVGGSEPTRSVTSLAALKRERARAARAAGYYSPSYGSYRSSGAPLILGVRF